MIRSCFPDVAIRRFLVVIILILFCCMAGRSQPADEQKIQATIAQLFSGMELGDSAMVRNCFVADPTMASVRMNREGQAILSRNAGLTDFLSAVGTPHSEKWYEEVWNMKISIDGQFAQVWCDYAFYVGSKFSHCGIDAFHLFRDGDRWKIFHLADTRRAQECDIPEEIRTKRGSGQK